MERFVEPEVDPPWRDPVLVECPRCGRRATVRAPGPREARLVCGGCGLVREWSGERLHAVVDGRRTVLERGLESWLDPATGRAVRDFTTEEGRDPRFDVALWLLTTCCGGRMLWANNGAHLDYLEAYVGGRLRDHAPGPAPLSARLPAWMKHAKNRDEVLRHLGRLRLRLDEV